MAWRADRSASGQIAEHHPLDELLAAEVAYTRRLRGAAALVARVTREKVLPVLADLPRTDSAGRQDFAAADRRRLQRALAEVRREVRRALPRDELDAIASEQWRRVTRASERTWIATVAGASGIRQRALAELVELGPDGDEELDDRELAAVLVARRGVEAPPDRREALIWARENKRLARSIGDQHVEKLGRKLELAIAAGVGIVALRALVTEQAQQTARRATIIAEDQTQKGVGAQQMQRSVAAGVTQYIWRTQLDDRVREEHAEREGQRFSWDAPPFDGHPGDPPNCRCVAEPVIPPVEELMQPLAA